MSNPTSVITERRLSEFYQEILPYLGGSADAGFTPVGSVIAIMGVTAPANYLACNGQIVNVADYPELANYFEQQFGTKYKFGGSGTTFGIPDLRGEFLRGTGTNSHANQGSGADVGTHQDGTEVPYLRVGSNVIEMLSTTSDTQISVVKADSSAGTANPQWYRANKTATTATGLSKTSFTSRPTNTSILWCIATKDIYLNPSMDYSTSEKVVGKWIDGKTIYQKTIQATAPATETNGTIAQKYISIGASIDNVISIKAVRKTGGYAWGEIPLTNPATTTVDTISGKTVVTSVTTLMMMAFVFDNNASTNSNSIRLTNNNTSWNDVPVYVTIQYTKTN